MKLLAVVALTGCGGGGGGGGSPPPPPPPPAPLATGPAACTAGTAVDFRCGGIDLRKRIPFAALGGSGGNDVWG